MPIFKADDKLVLYAHVPKCGGSSVATYLRSRFGKIAFTDTRHTRHDPLTVWSKTSPQHIDRQSLSRLFPKGFFDASFTIVRHPVGRLVSAYHFQLEVERKVPSISNFSEWLEEIKEMREENPFLYDNHVRPMSEIVPEDARVFHMEFGLDHLVPWFDALTGRQDGPRLIAKINERGDYAAAKGERVTPSNRDLERIAEIYATDFERFNYVIDQKAPTLDWPDLPPEIVAGREATLKEMNRPLRRLQRSLKLKKFRF